MAERLDALSLNSKYRSHNLALVALSWQHVTSESLVRAVERVQGFTKDASVVSDPLTVYESGELGAYVNPALKAKLQTCHITPRQYPKPAAQMYWWSFDGSTRVGRLLWCLVTEPIVHSTLDLFTAMGSGAALIAAHAFKTKGYGKVTSIELDAESARLARANLHEYAPFVDFQEGDGFQLLPLICPPSRRGFDVIMFDCQIVNARDLLALVLSSCIQQTNTTYLLVGSAQMPVQIEAVKEAVQQGFSLVLHDFSPELAGHRECCESGSSKSNLEYLSSVVPAICASMLQAVHRHTNNLVLGSDFVSSSGPSSGVI
eukprot:2832869-Amphidinium_carterae.3